MASAQALTPARSGSCSQTTLDDGVWGRALPPHVPQSEPRGQELSYRASFAGRGGLPAHRSAAVTKGQGAGASPGTHPTEQR